MRVTLRLLPYGLIPLFAGFAAMYLSIALRFTPPDRLILGTDGIEVLDRNGQTFYEFREEPGSRRIVPLSEVSPSLIDATVASEDADFWQNPGVNIRGLVRAAYENLAFWENGGLFKGSGGSSLSQQLAKNVYIPAEERSKRSITRKLRETVLAFELNRRYSKEQILEWYLSQLYYGNGAYGIEAASQRYFGKPPAQLSLAEAAMLAGIPRAPAVYDPIANFEAAGKRQQQVIGLMERHHFISTDEAKGALDQPVAIKEGKIPGSPAQATAAHFAVYVRDLLPQLIDKKEIGGRLRVTTTLDSALQAKAEQVVRQNLDRFEAQYGASNGALVAMDPKTGEIKAMVGSHDFFRSDISGQVNNATALNQPGSTMKPITYLAAFLKGWSPATIVTDEPMRIADAESSYVLANADGRYRGAVPVRTALGSSLNVPAVKALEYAGLQNVYDLARRMGLTTLQDISQYGPAFTMGGVDVTLLDMTYVSSVLANGGEQAGISSVLGLPKGSRPLDPVAVLKVESAAGKTVWQAKPRKERIVPANAAYLVTNVLSDDLARVSMFGSNSPLNLTGRKAAVKSGLSDGARDAWTIGYTPQLVTGVWVGNASNKPMRGATSTFVAAPIWRSFMQAALEGQPALEFLVPEGVQSVKVCVTTGLLPGASCRSVVSEVFMTGRAPTTTGERAAPQTNPSIAPTARPSNPSEVPTPTPKKDDKPGNRGRGGRD